MMSAEQSKAIVRRFQDAFDAGDWATLNTVVSPQAKTYQPGIPGPLDFDGFKQMGASFMDAFSESRHEVLSQIAEGDTVATRAIWHAVHTGSFNGLSASGKRIELPITTFDRIADGKIVEHAGLFDQMTLLVQLGMMPEQQAE